MVQIVVGRSLGLMFGSIPKVLIEFCISFLPNLLTVLFEKWMQILFKKHQSSEKEDAMNKKQLILNIFTVLSAMLFNVLDGYVDPKERSTTIQIKKLLLPSSYMSIET